jgi:RNA polymerase sigma factor (sigma-70 family)
MLVSAIEAHYLENRSKFVKRMYFRAGSIENAEDIVQEAYERALRYNKSYTGENYDRWFNTVLNNCLRDFKNDESGYSADVFDEEEAEGRMCPSYPNHVMREVFELIATKSLVQQEILTYFFKHEYSPVDISRITDYSYSNCHQIIRRFRQELKELYG